ncbi:hypothetical protein CLOP_g9398 [Closterium sp. NIES-67]|nr:hypothetical protein CLOP_g9398 [Closterium sp. NIES-67]
MAEAVAVVRAKKQAAEARGEAESSFPRSTSLLEEKFDAYERANLMIFRSTSDGAPSTTRDLDLLDTPDGSLVPVYAEFVPRGARKPVVPSDSANGGAEFALYDAERGEAWAGGAGGGGGGEGGASRREGSGNERAGASSSGGSESSADDGRGLGACRPGSSRRSCLPSWQGEQQRGDGDDSGGKGGSREKRRSKEGDSGSNGAERGGDGHGGGYGGAGGKAMGRGKSEDGVGAPLMRSLTDDMERSGAGFPRMESGGLHEAEMDEMDREVLQEAFQRVVALERRVQHYRDLGGFGVLMALFIAILYLQADSSRSYQITAAHSLLYPPGMSQDSSSTFTGAADFYQWLNTSIIQTLWADFTCGDGTCQRPFQFPAFGRFGCKADCGTFPNLTSVVVSFSSELDSQHADQASSWNLCMVNPVSLCWYDAMQPFPLGEADFSVPMDIPDGDWVVVLNAPAGGIRGTLHAPPPGTRRFSTIGSASTVELASWGHCTHDDDVDAANQTGLSGSDAAAAPDACRDTCVGLVVTCLPAACHRAFTEREVAGAFVDCARMCIVSPTTITLYAASPCPTADMGSLFPNTQCNTSAPASNSTAGTSRFNHRELVQALHRLTRPRAYGYWPASAALSSPPASSAATSLLVGAAGGAAAAASADAATEPALQVQGAPGAAAAAASLAAAVGAAAASPSPASLWSLLGATDRQRMTALQVAVSRALFTMAKDRCLAGRTPGREAKHLEGGGGSVRARIVACVCTVLGGPGATMEECRFTNETGQLIAAPGEMFAYLQRTHVRGGRVISSQHMRRFVQTVVAALRSATPMDDATAVRVSTLLHGFDDAIVTSDAVGCSQGGAWLPWRAGVKHNTTIHAGDKVTWVWDDDLPHSLRVAGMGEAGDPLFLGFGGHRLAVSRQLACSPMNAGAGDARDDPLPCVLRMDDEPSDSFSYSRVFERPATVYYDDGAMPGGALHSLSTSSDSSSSASFSSSASSACVLTVLPARTGSDAAGRATTTISSTTPFPTTTPTTTTTSPSSSPSSSPSAVYFCAPGCQLQRLANGVCNAACNTPSCAFDGGDCACVDPLFGPGICSCPPAHTRRDDGSCCVSTAVGVNLNFPFSLQRYGANYTETNHAFAAERGTAVNRFVSQRNRLLIGMVLQQDRWGTQECSGQGLMHLAGWCSNGTSKEPFGVNPHFLPTSRIFDSAASANMSQLDNSSFGVKLRFNPQGLPYGFIYPIESLAHFPLVFDINLDNDAATRRLEYLVEGGYIDNSTRNIQVSFITFNGEARTFVLTTVSCSVSAGGSIGVVFKSQPAAMDMYGTSTESVVRLVLEVLYVVGLLWNVYGEVQEMLDYAHLEGSVLGYFGRAWNWVDMLSLALQISAIVIWMVLWRYVEAFDMQPRYDIYYTLLEMPRYWAVPNPPTGFLSAAQAFLDLRNIINLRAVYFALQGINLFVMMVRLLKFMDFQPYLGVITRSLALATPSLLHFFLLSFAVFFCFSMYAFSTVLTSMFSCFLLLLNDNSSAYFFQRLESWDLIAAMLFFFMFIVFMVFILLNFLIAIIVDAFMSVKDANTVATSIAADLAHIAKYKWNCCRGRYLPYRRILHQLVELGAKDTRADEANRRMRRYKSIQRRVGSVLSGSIVRGVRASSHFTRADLHPAFPESSSSKSRVRRQHVLTVKEKRIDAISLSIILQRRHDREQSRGRQSATATSCEPVCSSAGEADAGTEADAGMEQLSQALVLQCGEVVKQAALPVKKPVQKLSLSQIQEEVVRSQLAVEEVRGMVADMQSEVRSMMAGVHSDMRSIMALLITHNAAATTATATPPLSPPSAAAAAAAAAAQLPASMSRAAMRPSPSQASPTQSTLRQRSPEHLMCQKRLQSDCRDEGNDSMAGDEGATGDQQAAVDSTRGDSSSTRKSRCVSAKRASGRRVSFRDGTADDDDEAALNRKETQQQLLEKTKYY